MEVFKSFLLVIRTRLASLNPDEENIELVQTEQFDSQPSYNGALPNGHGVNDGGHVAENGRSLFDENQDESTNDGKKSNIWQAGWNVANCMQGIGLLSLPYTVKEGGWAALATMAVVLLIGSYTSKILVSCMYDDDSEEEDETFRPRRRIRTTYSDIADSCYPWGGTVLIMQLIDMIVVATLYLELAGALLDDTFRFLHWSQLLWTIICTCALLPTVFFKNLTNISWLSLVAIVSLGLMFGSVGWYSIGQSVQWDINTMPTFELNSYFISASIILFNFGCQFLVPGVEMSMKRPSKFNKMVNLTYTLTAILTLVYSLSAYLTFKSNTKEFITFNMPLGPIQATVSLLFAIKSLLSYPLMMFLIVKTIDALNLHFLPPCFSNGNSYLPTFWAIVFRTMLVFFTLFLAVVIPHFALLMGFTGSLTAPWLDFIFPCIFHLKLKGHTLSWYTKAFDWSIIIIGAFGGIIGLIYSTVAMIDAIATDMQDVNLSDAIL